MIEQLFAAVGLALCVAMLVRMAIGARRRHRLDAVLRRTWWSARWRALRIWRWRSARREAARAAEEAIRRARTRHERDANVIRPDAFREPRKPH
jgi:hypothetical protein